MKKVTIADISPAIKTAVGAVLLAKAYAEVKREQVDKVNREILTECPLSNGLEVEHGQSHEDITDPKLVYLCTNQDLLDDYYAESNKRLRERGIKPPEMPDSYCPALVAEDVLRTAEHVLVEAAEPVFGVSLDQITCYLDKYHQYIDLLCGLVVNLPDFKNPLTGEGVVNSCDALRAIDGVQKTEEEV